MKRDTVKYLIVSTFLLMCVPVLGVTAFCLSVKLRRNLSGTSQTYRQLALQERTLLSIMTASCFVFC